MSLGRVQPVPCRQEDDRNMMGTLHGLDIWGYAEANGLMEPISR